jgi:hypothetical protein
MPTYGSNRSGVGTEKGVTNVVLEEIAEEMVHDEPCDGWWNRLKKSDPWNGDMTRHDNEASRSDTKLRLKFRSPVHAFIFVMDSFL